MIEEKYLIGAAIGVAGTAAAVYLYQKNKTVVNDFLRDQGIDIPDLPCADYAKMSLEELVSTQEMIEDLVAERQVPVEEA